MSDLAQLGIRVDASQLARARREMDMFANSGRKASHAIGIALRQVAAFTTGVAAASRTMAAADSYTNLTNRMRALGASHEEAASQVQQLVDVANQTWAPVNELSGLYTRASLAAKSLGINQKELFTFVEAASTALAVSGSSAKLARGALLQLGQSLTSVQVRAEEFNSMMEGSPGILVAAANEIEGINGDLGKLRNMMLDGALTSKIFFDAIVASLDDSQEAFSRTQMTVQQSMYVFENYYTLFIGRANESLGVTRTLADAIVVFGQNLDILVPSIAAVVGGLSFAFMPVLTTVIGTVTLASASIIALAGNWDTFTSAFPGAASKIEGAVESLRTAFSAVSMAIAGVSALIRDEGELANFYFMAMTADAKAFAYDFAAGTLEAFQLGFEEVKRFLDQFEFGRAFNIDETFTQVAEDLSAAFEDISGGLSALGRAIDNVFGGEGGTKFMQFLGEFTSDVIKGASLTIRLIAYAFKELALAIERLSEVDFAKVLGEVKDAILDFVNDLVGLEMPASLEFLDFILGMGSSRNYVNSLEQRQSQIESLTEELNNAGTAAERLQKAMDLSRIVADQESYSAFNKVLDDLEQGLIGVDEAIGFIEKRGRAWGLVDEADQIIDYLNQISASATGTSDQLKKMSLAVDEVTSAVTTQLEIFVETMPSLGEDAMAGFAQGIRNGTADVGEAARNAAFVAIEAVKDAQQSASPAVVFIELGNDAVQGYAKGIKTGSSAVEKAGQSMVDTLRDNAENQRLLADTARALADGLRQTGESASETTEELDSASSSTQELTDEIIGVSAAAKSATGDINNFADEIERLEDAADPTRKFRREMEKLGELRALENGLSEGAYAEGVRRLNEELVESTPLLSGVNDAFGQMVDYMFDGFKDGMAGIWNIFKNTLKQMAAAALKNRITIGVGMAATGGASAAAAGQGGGILSGSGFLGLGGGAGSLFGGSGLLGMGGGSGFLGLGAGSGLAGALGGGAFGAAASVALPVIGIGLAIAGLFKKTEVIVSEGVRVRLEGAALEIDKYTKSKTNNALGFSSSFKRDFDRLDDAAQQAVQQSLDGTISALEAFGLNTDLTGFAYSRRASVGEGETAEGETQRIIGEVLDEAIRYLTDDALEVFRQTGEGLSDTLDRLTTSFNGVSETLYLFGQSMLPVSLEGAAAASALLDLSGGLEAFNNKAGYVFSNFLTETEQQTQLAAIAQEQLNATFSDLNKTVPETHAEYMALLDAQDLTTEAGRNTYAALLDVAQAFVVVNGAAQNLAAVESERQGLLTQLYRLTGDENALRQQQLIGLDESNRALQEQIWGIQDANAAQAEAERIVAENYRAAQKALRSAEQDVRDAFSAEEDRIRAAYQDQIDAAIASADAANAITRAQAEESDRLRRERIEGLSGDADALSDRVRLYRSIADALERAYTDRRVLTALGRRMQLTEAQAFLQGAVNSGGTSNLKALREALKTVENPSTALFKSFSDYQHDFNINTNLIEKLRDLSNDTLTTEEMTLRTLNEQIDVLRDTSSEQVDSIEANTSAIERARDAEISALNRQMNALLGINTSVLSVRSAISALEIARKTVNQTSPAPGAANGSSGIFGSSDANGDGWIDPGSPLFYARYRPNSIEGQINEAYNDILSRNVDAAGLDFYARLVRADNGFGVADVMADLQKNAASDTGVPAFALGGVHGGGWRMVGENGPELEYTGPSRIYSTRDSRSMMDTSRMEDSLTELNDRIRRLQIEVKRQGTIFRDWNTNGQPGTRDGAVVTTEAAS